MGYQQCGKKFFCYVKAQKDFGAQQSSYSVDIKFLFLSNKMLRLTAHLHQGRYQV
jgi:hypothetical protein